MLASDFDAPLRSKGLAKEERRSLLTLARLSDQKAWPNTASNFDPRLRSWMHQTSTYISSPTNAVGAN